MNHLRALLLPFFVVLFVLGGLGALILYSDATWVHWWCIILGFVICEMCIYADREYFYFFTPNATGPIGDEVARLDQSPPG